MDTGKLLLLIATVLLAVGTAARWQGMRGAERASELVDRSRDASLEFVTSLDGSHNQAEVELLDARRASLMSAARWRATSQLAWASAFVVLLGAWVAVCLREVKPGVRATG